MGAAEAAQTLPLWAVYTIGGLAATCGLFFAFVLGLIAYAVKQRGGDNASSEHIDAGAGSDCSDCQQMALAREEFRSVWDEIKTLRSDITTRLDNLFTLLSKK